MRTQIRLIDVARMAGVSKATASRALAGSPVVSEKTRRHIEGIAKELGYVPNALARAVATKRSGILGLCIYRRQLPYFAHTFFGPLLDGAMVEAKENGYHIVVTSSDQDDDTFDEHFIQDSIDGAVLISFTPLAAVREFRRRRIPLVLVNDLVDTRHNDFVIQDDYGGAEAMMDHLFDLGHRRIAFLSDRLSHVSYHLRYLAYLQAHHRRGLSIYEDPALEPAPDLWGPYPRPSAEKLGLFGLSPQEPRGSLLIAEGISPLAGARAAQALLGAKTLPTALFVTADSLAIGAMRALHEAGIRVPEDISVAGFDDISLSDSVWPPLTTVKAAPFEMGRAAVRRLIGRIREPELEIRVCKVPTHLIIRNSTTNIKGG